MLIFTGKFELILYKFVYAFVANKEIFDEFNQLKILQWKYLVDNIYLHSLTILIQYHKRNVSIIQDDFYIFLLLFFHLYKDIRGVHPLH